MSEGGVVFLPSYFEAIKDLPDEMRLQIYDAVIRYGLYGEIMELDAIPQSLFTLMKPNIDSSKNRYRASVENGSKPPKPGSRPRGRPRKNQTENQSKNQDIDLDYDSEKENDSDLERKKTNAEQEADFMKLVRLAQQEDKRRRNQGF